MKDLREMLLQERDERIDGDTNIDNFFRFRFYNSLLIVTILQLELGAVYQGLLFLTFSSKFIWF